jgi:hypothetical protein
VRHTEKSFGRKRLLCSSFLSFALRYSLAGDGQLCWQQPELAAWEVPKRNPHERRPRAPDWGPNKVGAEIAELAAAEAV